MESRYFKLEMAHAVGSAHLAARISGIAAESAESDLDITSFAEKLRLLSDAAEKISESGPSSEHLQAWTTVSLALRLAECAFLQSSAARGQGNASEIRDRIRLLRPELDRLSTSEGEGGLATALLEAVDGDGIINASPTKLLLRIARADLPTLYYKNESENSHSHGYLQHERESSPAVIKLVAFLDGLPLASPQLVRANISYTLEIELHWEEWPTEATGLRFRFLTTMPATSYEHSKFQLDRGDSRESISGHVKGSLLLRSPQSLLAEPVAFSVCGEWCTATDAKALPAPEIVGHNVLTLRVAGSDDVFTSGYRRLDSHIAHLLRDALAEEPTLRDELRELVPLLEALTNLLGQFAQGGVLKSEQQVSEREFRQEALKLLRVRLGEDAQEHVNQAGGESDIRYRGVVLELKVVHQTVEQATLAKKYGEQTTQYEGIEARRIGVLLILDLAEKIKPPGDLRNYISLHEIAVHGDAEPSRVFVFVVNGNLRSPSTYSR